MLPSKLSKKLVRPAYAECVRLPFLYNTKTILRAYSGDSDVAFAPFILSNDEIDVDETGSGARKTANSRRARTARQDDYDSGRDHSYARGAAAQYNNGRRSAPERRTRVRSSVAKQEERKQDVPFEKSKNTLERLEGSTMTWAELKRFEKLFQMGTTETADSGRKSAKSRKDKTAKSPNNRAVTHAKPEFPDLLRPLAEEAALLRAQANSSSSSTERMGEATEIASESAEYLKDVKDKMDKARFDTDLWEILQKHVFDQVGALAATHRYHEPGPEVQVMLQDFHSLKEKLPDILLHFMRLIQTSFPGSTLGLVLLPTLKRLGSSAFALGATTDLFNQHMRLLYKHYTDLEGICDTLSEMDKEVYEFDVGTQRLLSIIFSHANASRHGQNGPGLQALWLTDRKARALTKLARWQEIVDEKVAARAARAREAKQAESDHTKHQ